MPSRPKIVLVGQLSVFPWVFEAAERAGVDVVLVPRGDDTQESARSAPAVVGLLPLDIEGDPDGALSSLVDHFRREPFDGIMAGNEQAVPFVARAASTLGLTGLTEQAAAVVRDKRSMRRRLREAGLGCPGFVVLDDVGATAAAARSLRFPVVVKPANGHSSFGVIRVEDRDDLTAAVERTWELVEGRLGADDGLATERGVLVEEYLDGPEVSAESLVHRGRVQVCAISWKGELTGPYFQETTLRAPARLPAEVLAAIEAEVVGAHRAFGVTEGATHTELRLVGGVRPVLLEMGARIGGGGYMAHFALVSTGIDMAVEALRVHLGHAPRRPSPEDAGGTGHVAVYQVPVGPGGRVRCIRGLAAVREDPHVEYLVVSAEPGAVLRPYPDFSGYPVIVISRHATDEDAEAYRARLEQTLFVEYEDENHS